MMSSLFPIRGFVFYNLIIRVLIIELFYNISNAKNLFLCCKISNITNDKKKKNFIVNVVRPKSKGR